MERTQPIIPRRRWKVPQEVSAAPGSEGEAVEQADQSNPMGYDADEDGLGAMGMVEDFKYEDFKAELGANHIIVIVTDGIWESKNPDGEMYGKSRLREAVAAHRSDTSAGIL